jgi:hypothetical protein
MTFLTFGDISRVFVGGHSADIENGHQNHGS